MAELNTTQSDCLQANIPLHKLAHGRTGDKGNTSNISVIAYRPEFYSILLEQVTVERVAELFRHRQPTAIQRYELPKLHALNFVLEDLLDGGVNQSLNLDSHGKTLAFLLLGLMVAVPADLFGVRRECISILGQNVPGTGVQDVGHTETVSPVPGALVHAPILLCTRKESRRLGD